MQNEINLINFRKYKNLKLFLSATKFKEKPVDPSKENVIDATGTSKNTGTINSASRTLCFSKTLLVASLMIFILLLR